MRRLIGYRFGKSYESYLIPIIIDTHADDETKVSELIQWVKDNPAATEQHERLSRMSELGWGQFDPDPEGIYR